MRNATWEPIIGPDSQLKWISYVPAVPNHKLFKHVSLSHRLQEGNGYLLNSDINSHILTSRVTQRHPSKFILLTSLVIKSDQVCCSIGQMMWKLNNCSFTDQILAIMYLTGTSNWLNVLNMKSHHSTLRRICAYNLTKSKISNNNKSQCSKCYSDFSSFFFSFFLKAQWSCWWSVDISALHKLSSSSSTLHVFWMNYIQVDKVRAVHHRQNYQVTWQWQNKNNKKETGKGSLQLTSIAAFRAGMAASRSVCAASVISLHFLPSSRMRALVTVTAWVRKWPHVQLTLQAQNIRAWTKLLLRTCIL